MGKSSAGSSAISPKSVPAKDLKVDLVAHSGGGSFIFGFLNGGDKIPDNIERIAWIDANYAYDNENEHHGDKLLAWLKGDATRHLVVIAYNDRAATLNGKPFVSETGGTFYRSHRMVEFFSKSEKLERNDQEPFEFYVGMHGPLRFELNTNPEKRILHTVLVERNGFLEALSWDTPFHDKWGGTFWGDRAYSELIEPLVVLKTKRAPTSAPTSAKAQAVAATNPFAKPQAGLAIPARASDALGGKGFAEKIMNLPPKDRESAIVAEIKNGNVPEFQRKFVDVSVKDGKHSNTYSVIPDYLAVGSDADHLEMPMTPGKLRRRLRRRLGVCCLRGRWWMIFTRRRR